MRAELERGIRRILARDGIPGLALALVRDGEIVHASGYGVADLDSGSPVTARTRFGAASITKPVLATGLMRRYEQGRFSLDDPVDRHIAPLRFENPFATPVTLRMLLTHTAGLPVGNAPAAPGAATLREQVAAGARAVHEPGGRIVYANWGYDILGHLYGEIAGRPWPEALREDVLEPLGMRASGIGQPPEAQGYYRSRIDGRHRPVPFAPAPCDPPTAAGSLTSCAEDLARFLILHTSGGRHGDQPLLRPETIAAMHALQAPAGASHEGMGLGFRVARPDGETLLLHGGDGLGTTNLIALRPERRIGVVLLMNLRGAQAARAELAHAALRLLAGEPAEDTATVEDAPLLPEWVCGRYRSSYWNLLADLGERDGRAALTVVRGDILDGGEPSSRLSPLGEGRWRARGGMFDGLELCFERGPGDDVRCYGGVYPFELERSGPVPDPPAAPDPSAKLEGVWRGSCQSPLGELPFELRVLDAARAQLTLLGVRDAPLEAASAARGRVTGECSLEVPVWGRFRVYLRLAAAGDALAGSAIASGDTAELELPVELARA